MGYVIPTGYSRVSFDFDAATVTGSKPSWGFGVSVNPSVEFLDDLYAWWQDSLQPITNAGVFLNRIEMRNDFTVEEKLVGALGGRAGEYSAPQVAALVKLTTGVIGKKNRGRIYWPFITLDTEIDGSGRINSTPLERIQESVDDLRAFIVSQSATMVILHSTELTPTEVTDARAQQQTATQRRRNRR